VHFHLLNVQVINRVGWDGTIKPPHANEYGWKETVLMNPLEDIVVAVRAKKPKLPGFGLPFSQRLRDPSQPDGVPMGFTQINPTTGNPAVVTNQMDNLGWEYVWHCHILGHEENDFMRPIKFNANEAVPLAPTGLSFAAGTTTLKWTDNAQTEYKYQVYSVVTTGAGANAVATATLVDTALANATSKTLAAVNPAANYAVVAVGGNGRSAALYQAPDAVAAPTINGTALVNATRASVTFTDGSTNERSFVVEVSGNGGLTWIAMPATVVNNNRILTTTQTYTVNVNGLSAGNVYKFRVTARGIPVFLDGLDMTATSVPAVSADLVFAAPDAPAIVVPAAPATAVAMARIGATATDRATMDFAAAAAGVAATSYRVQYVAVTPANALVPPVGGWTSVTAANTTITANTISAVVPRGTAGTTKYWVRINGVNAVGNGVSSVPVMTPVTQ
jgi:hypothetical protein